MEETKAEAKTETKKRRGRVQRREDILPGSACVASVVRGAKTKFVEVPDAEVVGVILGLAESAKVDVGSSQREVVEAMTLKREPKAFLVLKAIAMVSVGDLWKDVMAATGLTYSELSRRCPVCPVYRAVFKAAIEAQKEAHREKARDALMELVTEGERIPVVTPKGEVVDERYTRPVKAIELALKIGGEAVDEKDGGGAKTVVNAGPTYNIVMPQRKTVEEYRKEKGIVVDAEVVEPKALPSSASKGDFTED